MNKVGKPKKYDEKELLDILLDIARKFPEKKITFSLLEHNSDIPRYIWTSPAYPKIQNSITELNKNYLLTRTSTNAKIIANNLLSSIHKAKGDEKKINEIGNDYNRALNQLISILETKEAENQMLKKENNSLKKALKVATENEIIYKRLYHEAFVKSSIPSERLLNGLDRNISSLDNGFLPPDEINEQEIKKKINDLLND